VRTHPLRPWLADVELRADGGYRREEIGREVATAVVVAAAIWYCPFLDYGPGWGGHA
jgi:hypothetical protein